MSETNHTNAGAEAPLKTGAPKANICRRFPTWVIHSIDSCPIHLPDGTYIYATVDNCPDPKDPHLYVATITRETSTGSGTRYEDLRQQSFDDLIEALLYLESVALVKSEPTNE